MIFDDLMKENMGAEAVKCALLGDHAELYELAVSQLKAQAQVMFLIR